jgi:hypothetical protein
VAWRAGADIPLGDLERAMNTHRGKPGHQALQKSFPGRAFSNRAEEMAHVSSEVGEDERLSIHSANSLFLLPPVKHPKCVPRNGVNIKDQ